MSSVLAPEVILRSVWKTGQDFLEHIIQQDPPRFFHRVPQDRALPPGGIGELMSVLISLEDREAEFHVHARIIDRREGSEKRGMTLEVIPEERDRMALILVAASGESMPYRRRRHERITCRLDCKVTAADGRIWRCETTNINEGGLHAAVDEPLPPPGSPVEVEFELGGRRWELSARVSATIAAGPQKGVGVEFLFASARQRDELRGEVARLRLRAGR
jgi:hypothetical protein